MNNQATIEKMKQMRLSAMAETYYNSMQNNMHRDYTLDQYLALLVDQEWECRYNKRIQNLILGQVQVSGIRSGCQLYGKPFAG